MRLIIGTILFLGAVMLFTGFGLARLKVRKAEPPPPIQFETVRMTGGSDQIRLWRSSFRRASSPELRTQILAAAADSVGIDGITFLKEVASGAEDHKLREQAQTLLVRAQSASAR